MQKYHKDYILSLIGFEVLITILCARKEEDDWKWLQESIDYW